MVISGVFSYVTYNLNKELFPFIGPWPSKWLPPKPLQGERRREQPRKEGAGQSQKRNIVVVVDASAAQRQKVGRREAVDAESLAN